MMRISTAIMTAMACGAFLVGRAGYCQTTEGKGEKTEMIQKDSGTDASGDAAPASAKTAKAKTAGRKAKGQKGKAPGAEKSAQAETKGVQVDENALKLYEAREFKGMPYRLMKPIDFDPSKTYPLILSLHGRGGVGSDNLGNLRVWTGYLAREELRRRHPCFVVCPQTATGWTTTDEKTPELTEETIKAYPEAWQRFYKERMASRGKAAAPAGAGDLSKAFDLVGELAKEFPIDRSRLYVLGHSMGGFGSWNAIHEKPDMFAAAIPTAGALPPWKDPKRFANVPIWSFHGAADALVPVELTRLIFDAMKQCGGNMKYTEMQGMGHGCNVPAFDYKGDDPAKGWITQYSSPRCDKESNVWDWLFKQKRD